MPNTTNKNTAKNVLSLINISKNFYVKHGILGQKSYLKAINNVNIHMQKGETLGILGESGCGKSTLGRIIAGLLKPSSGQILIDGQSLYAPHGKIKHDGSIQMVFQDPYSSLNPRISIGSSIAEPLIVKNIPKNERLQLVHDILELIGFEAKQSKHYPHEFSGGQRQRIAIARALVSKPKILICDEPVSALDASVQAQILNLLCDTQDLFAPTCIFISHDLAVVGFMCPRIIVMYLGSIVEDAPREQIFYNPAHPYTKALLASIPSLDPTKKLTTPPLEGEIPSPLNPPQGCSFNTRCPQVMPICKVKEPKWINLTKEHKTKCHLYDNN